MQITQRLPSSLPYRKPTHGQDYWVVDDVLADPGVVRERCLARTDWLLGFPHREEIWPGVRCRGALLPGELATLEARVTALTGARRLWNVEAHGDAAVCHNHAQVVGATEATAKPHTDSRLLCRFAAVVYLNPAAPEHAGTTFYRQRLTNGALGGNRCPPRHANLVGALGVRKLPLGAWQEDVRVANRFNRLLLYRADMVHSASCYFGRELADKRMTAVFFWMAQF